MQTWSLTLDQLDQGRVNRARKLSLENIVINHQTGECHAECISTSTGEVYRVSLTSCTCRDFTVSGSPCKHIIRLAMEAGLLGEKEDEPSVLDENTDPRQYFSEQIYRIILLYLQQRNIPFVDMCPSGGSLYIMDKAVVDDLSAVGVNLRFASKGTRSTNHTPAWYYKPQKSRK